MTFGLTKDGMRQKQKHNDAPTFVQKASLATPLKSDNTNPY